jgi:hypothetical protein
VFRRKDEFVMELDVDVNYPLEKLRQQEPGLAAMPIDELKGLAFLSLQRQVYGIALEELRSHRQQWKTPTTEVMGEADEFAKFRLYFKGDSEGATKAWERWAARVETMGGVARISHASLRGTEGTNLHYYDEAIEQAAARLSERELALIDKAFEGRPESGPIPDDYK